MKIIFLIMIGLLSLSHADFTRENGVVTDSKTNLEWQDNYSNQPNTLNDIKRTTWSEAINYCEELNLNGHGWRLPNVKELKSLVRRQEPAIHHIFRHYNRLTIASFWSSTTNTNNSDEAWIVSFFYGRHSYLNKDQNKYTRCVRNKQFKRIPFLVKMLSRNHSVNPPLLRVE